MSNEVETKFHVEQLTNSVWSMCSKTFESFDQAVRHLETCDDAEPGTYRVARTDMKVSYEMSYPARPVRRTAAEALNALAEKLNSYQFYDSARKYAQNRVSSVTGSYSSDKVHPEVMGINDLTRGAALGVEFVDNILKEMLKGLRVDGSLASGNARRVDTPA